MEHSSVILIVDDNPEFIHMTGTLLTRNGYEVRVADSGRQALSLLDREIPDLILLDIRMPEMDGLAVCRQIRENSRCEDTAILFITGEQDRRQPGRGLPSGRTGLYPQAVSLRSFSPESVPIFRSSIRHVN